MNPEQRGPERHVPPEIDTLQNERSRLLKELDEYRTVVASAIDQLIDLPQGLVTNREFPLTEEELSAMQQKLQTLKQWGMEQWERVGKKIEDIDSQIADFRRSQGLGDPTSI